MDHLDHAERLYRSGDLAAAERHLRRAVEQSPTDPRAFRLAGLLLLAAGRYDEAIASLEAVCLASPHDAECRLALGNAYYLRGRYADAEWCYRAVLEIRPDDPDALLNLGAAVADLGRHDEAIAAYERVLALRPEMAEARYNLANSLRVLGRLDPAEANYREVLRQNPEFAEAFNNLGVVLLRKRDLAGAEIAHRQALRLRPDSAESWTNLGLALAEQGWLDEALVCYERALAIRPESPDAHRNRALARLLQGNLAQGFPDYEWRLRCDDFTPTAFLVPQWDGRPQAGATLLLHAEQGLGDTLQFVRYAAIAKERVGSVWLAAPERLLPLLRTVAGVDRVVALGTRLAGFDLHASLMSLPAILGTTLRSIPAAIPYLRADPTRCDRWRAELAGRRGLQVGVAWQADPLGYRGGERSIPVRYFNELGEIPGVRLISLQKPPRDLAEFEPPDPARIDDLSARLDVGCGAFEDTLAVIDRLDLVITCDTAIAHLAGAAGAPTWVALPHVPDWRWMLHRADSPWYPSLRLFRQPAPGEWSAVFEQIAAELRRRADG